ncbi:MAG: PaREP1 family protein [Sulfolobales archaeon]
MSLVVPERIAEMLRREAEKHGLTPEEYILEHLIKNQDPVQRGREYIEASIDIIRQAEKELERGDLKQALEKIWGACALAIKAHALIKRNLRLESLKIYGSIKTRLRKSLENGLERHF